MKHMSSGLSIAIGRIMVEQHCEPVISIIYTHKFLAWEANALPAELLPHFSPNLSFSLAKSIETRRLSPADPRSISIGKNGKAWVGLVEFMVERRASFRMPNEGLFALSSEYLQTTLVQGSDKSKASLRDGNGRVRSHAHLLEKWEGPRSAGPSTSIQRFHNGREYRGHGGILPPHFIKSSRLFGPYQGDVCLGIPAAG
jgi:hypothetical protein